MLQALLAERFKLVLHRETKELPVYALLLVESRGPELQPAKTEPPSNETNGGALGFRNKSMSELAERLPGAPLRH